MKRISYRFFFFVRCFYICYDLFISLEKLFGDSMFVSAALRKFLRIVHDTVIVLKDLKMDHNLNLGLFIDGFSRSFQLFADCTPFTPRKILLQLCVFKLEILILLVGSYLIFSTTDSFSDSSRRRLMNDSWLSQLLLFESLFRQVLCGLRRLPSCFLQNLKSQSVNMIYVLIFIYGIYDKLFYCSYCCLRLVKIQIILQI